MSADHFDRVSAIARRQPELDPKPHVRSAQTLHYQLQLALAERDKARADVAELRDLAEGVVTLFGDVLLPTPGVKHLLDGARALLAKLDAEGKS